MRLFYVRSQVHSYQKLPDFAGEFSLGKNDLIFTIKPIYEQFLNLMNLKCDCIFQEMFGEGEPTDVMVDKIKSAAGINRYDRIVGIGGGTIIDISKLLCLRGTKKTLDILKDCTNLVKEKQLIIVPTTCGTGSEVTNISVISFEAKKTKKGIVSDSLYPDHAVLIPELLKALPYRSFLLSSIDALIHASESFLSPRSNAYTDMFCLEAIKAIITGYMALLENGADHRFEILNQFLLASNFSGMAFNNTGVGAVHALSYPLGSAYHIAHGESNYIFFIKIFKTYSSLKPQGKIDVLNKFLSNILGIGSTSDVYSYLEENILNKLLPLKKLAFYGVKKEDLEILADRVIEEQQRLLSNNYTTLSRKEIFDIYKALY